MTFPGAFENARTLAAVLGITESTAGALLGKRILITARPNALAHRFSLHVAQLLSRTFVYVHTFADGSSYDVEIAIGDVASRAIAGSHVLFVWFDHDTVVLGPERPAGNRDPIDCHEVILLLGACYAAAAVARLALPGLPIPPAQQIRLSANDLLGSDVDVLRAPFKVPVAHLAGAGAIGNSFVYALSMFDVSGQLHVCDPDLVSEGNLNRCVFFQVGDLNNNKASVLCHTAQPRFRRLSLVPFTKRLEVFPPTPDGRTFQRLIVGVDSRRARRTLQFEFPREVYDASTTGIQEIVLHFNRLPPSAACLCCVYHQEAIELSREQHIADVLGLTLRDVRENWITRATANRICERYPTLSPAALEGEAYDSLFKMLCGEGKLTTAPDRQVFAPFAFVSVLAGSMLAIEFARRVVRGETVAPFNYWRLSPWSQPVPRLRLMRPRLPNCEFCAKEVYRLGKRIWE
jgi:hypothetical protein